MRRIGLVLVFAAAGVAHGQGTASGTLTIGKDKFEMKYSAAMLVPDSFEKTKSKTRIVVADKPVPADLLGDEGKLWDLKTRGFMPWKWRSIPPRRISP